MSRSSIVKKQRNYLNLAPKDFNRGKNLIISEKPFVEGKRTVRYRTASLKVLKMCTENTIL